MTTSALATRERPLVLVCAPSFRNGRTFVRHVRTAGARLNATVPSSVNTSAYAATRQSGRKSVGKVSERGLLGRSAGIRPDADHATTSAATQATSEIAKPSTSI